MKDVLSYIITSIVDNKDTIEITETEEDGMITLTVSIAQTDMGKVIGKEGRVIKAIKNVIRIPALKAGKRVYISLVEKTA